MREKFDLKKMLKEIAEESEAPVAQKKNVKMTQADIKKMLMKKKKGDQA